jgi:hypothetical protein
MWAVCYSAGIGNDQSCSQSGRRYSRARENGNLPVLLCPRIPPAMQVISWSISQTWRYVAYVHHSILQTLWFTSIDQGIDQASFVATRRWRRLEHHVIYQLDVQTETLVNFHHRKNKIRCISDFLHRRRSVWTCFDMDWIRLHWLFLGTRSNMYFLFLR